MHIIWMTASYLVGLTRQRVRALANSSDAGALSLEWIVIAVVLFIAATAAGVVFSNARDGDRGGTPGRRRGQDRQSAARPRRPCGRGLRQAGGAWLPARAYRLSSRQFGFYCHDPGERPGAIPGAGDGDHGQRSRDGTG